MKMIAGKKTVKTIRWMGAFAKGGSLLEALTFELGFTGTVACEQFQTHTNIRSNVGFLCNRKAIISGFSRDCWSRRSEKTGRLVYGEMNPNSKHNEIWISGSRKFTALVVKSLNFNQFEVVKDFAKNNNLPLLLLKEGMLLEVKNA